MMQYSTAPGIVYIQYLQSLVPLLYILYNIMYRQFHRYRYDTGLIDTPVWSLE